MSMFLKKILNSCHRRLINRLPHNVIINNLTKPVSFDDLSMLQGIKILCFNMKSSGCEEWVNQYFLKWRDEFGHLRHKKLIELYTTFTLLDLHPDDVFMDAAGGGYTYINKLECRKRYLQDIKILRNLKSHLGNNISYIESDACEIKLPNESIDKISCHHSFEHFQADSDILFIKEVQRLLKINGKCCIIPILIANRYWEVTNSFTFNKKFDKRSKLIIDPTASLPGGKDCGNYARIYDIEAFQKRILDNINFAKFKVTVAELRMNGDVIPDLTLSCHKHVAVINYPYRTMLIEKFR